MFLFTFFCIKRSEFLTPGYNTVNIPDNGRNFSLNYTLDYIFLFDFPNSYQIKLKFLDMIEPEIINPSSYGFSGQLLTDVEITPLTNNPHMIQLFSLPRSYCSHNYISYFSDQHQKTKLSWGNVLSDNFQICYLYQFPGKQIKLKAQLNANELSNASYALPSDYIHGNFSGKIISKSTEFDLEDGIIVRIQGYSSSSSNFELSIKPIKSQQTNNYNFASLPFYYIAEPNGYNFQNDLNVQLEIMRERFLTLSLANILGIVLASVILLLVIILTFIFFLQKFELIKKKKKAF